jgi:hypothetical protein
MTGAVLGFRYEGCRAILELYGLWSQDVLRGLRIIEREVAAGSQQKAPPAASGVSSSFSLRDSAGQGRTWLF